MSEAGSPFRIAHLSDFHFRHHLPGSSSLPRRRSRDGVLEPILARVKAAGVDLLVVTGDLLDVPCFMADGVPRGFAMPGVERWAAAARADYRYLRERLEATGIPYRVVPGNHDDPAAFAEVFGDLPADSKVGPFRVLCFADWDQEGHRPRRLTPARDLFEDALGDGDATPQIHVQHYLLHQLHPGGYPYHYEEAVSLRREIAASKKVRLCLSGHYHPGKPLFEEDGTFYSTVPAAAQAPHGWRVVEMTPGGGVTVTEEALPEPPRAPVAFLDRDGVINDLAAYTFGPEEMRLIPGSAAAIARLNQAGVRVVVVTSQSAIGYGYVTEAVVRMVNERMNELLAQEGAVLDAIYYSQGAGAASVLPALEALPTAKAELIQQALEELPLDRERGCIVGDRCTDMEAGWAHGLPGYLVRTGHGCEEEGKLLPGEAATAVDHLAAAVDLFLARLG